MMAGRVVYDSTTDPATDAAVGDLDDTSRTAMATFMGWAWSPIVPLVVRIVGAHLPALTVFLERPSKFGFRR